MKIYKCYAPLVIKKYGEFWQEERNELEVEEEFYAFLYKKYCKENNEPYSRFYEVPEWFKDDVRNGNDGDYYGEDDKY